VTVPVEDVPPVTEVGLSANAVTVGALIVKVAVAEVLFALAVIVAVVLLATAVVVTVKVAVDAPEATVTELGTVADVLLLDRLTTYPEDGAGDEIVIVPVEAAPPATEVGLSAKAVTVGAEIVNDAVFETELSVPVMVADVVDATAVVETAKVAVVAPEAIVTEPGTVADVELLERERLRPPLGAADPIVAVPVEEFPPTTEVGDIVMDVKLGGAIVKVAVAEVLFALAVTVAVVLLATAVVVTVKVAVVAPDATVTVPGMVAEVLLLERLTTYPEDGAAEEIVTVPVEEAPPVNDVGLSATAVTVGAPMVKVAVAEVLFPLPVIVAVVLLATAVVVTVKVAVVAPEATVT
jgi:hypothetical protein